MLQTPLFNVSLFVLCWAAEIFVTKLAFLAGAQVIPFTVQSGIAALLFLLLAVLPKHHKEIASLVSSSRKVLWQVILANAIHYGVGSFLYVAGMAFTQAINAAFLITLTGVLTPSIAALLLSEKMGRNKLIALVAMFLGAYLLTTEAKILVPHIGDLLIVFACIFWSLGNVLLRKALRDEPVSGEVVSLLKPIIGVPLFCLFVTTAPLMPQNLQIILQESIFQFDQLSYAIASGVLAALLWIFLYRTLKVATASYMSMIGMITPVLVTVLAVSFLGESVSTIQIIGSGIILGSGVLTHVSGFSQK